MHISLYRFFKNYTFLTDLTKLRLQMDKRTNGQTDKWIFLSSLTLKSITHVSIMTLRYVVSETDRQTDNANLYLDFIFFFKLQLILESY